MGASVFSSSHLAQLFQSGETGRLFSDSAEIRAMMITLGALAKTQGQLGIIPEISAAAIHRASLEIQIDPSGLAKATGENGVCIPALVSTFRDEMKAPEHAQYIHWGATSQDIQDTGLMLRLRQVFGHYETSLRAILNSLATLAKDHATTPMAARTYGQHALPTSFGAVAAQWGAPLLSAIGELDDLRDTCLWVSLSGAAGTSAVFADDANALRAAMADALGLNDPQRSWHSDRTPILKLAAWITRVAAMLGKIGEDLTSMSLSGITEIDLGGAGASSTMPQKQNPVAPSVLVALAHQANGLNTSLQGAGVHRNQRDGAAWFTEWLTLPQLCLGLASQLHHMQNLAASIRPNTQIMAANLDATGGFLMAEALSFALTDRMPRPEAQQAVKTLCQQARETSAPLMDLARKTWPDLPEALFDPIAQIGTAPQDARRFADQIKAL